MSDFDPRELVSAFIDGELRGEELDAFEAALESDPELAAEVSALRALVSELGELPMMEVPSKVSESVLARVATMPIPGTEAAAVALIEEVTEPLDASSDLLANTEDTVGLITETGVAADIPKLALSAITGPRGLSGLVDAFVGSLWLKVPTGAAVAALLALGLSYVISPQEGGPPPAQFAALESVSAEVPGVAGAYGDAAVVGLDQSEVRLNRETSPIDGDDFKDFGSESLMERPAARVRSGSAAAPARDGSSKRSRRKAKPPKSVVGPDGVYEAEWEAEDGVVDGEEAPLPTGGEFEDEGENEELAEDEVAQVRGGRSAVHSVSEQASDTRMEGESLEDKLEIEDDRELFGRQSAALKSAQSGAAVRRDSAPAASPEPRVASRSRKKKSSVKSASPPVPSTGNRLQVGSRARANRLVQDLNAVPRYDLQVSRHPTFFVLNLRVPADELDAALVTLRAAGELDFAAGSAASGEQQRVRLDVLW